VSHLTHTPNDCLLSDCWQQQQQQQEDVARPCMDVAECAGCWTTTLSAVKLARIAASLWMELLSQGFHAEMLLCTLPYSVGWMDFTICCWVVFQLKFSHSSQLKFSLSAKIKDQAAACLLGCCRQIAASCISAVTGRCSVCFSLAFCGSRALQM